MIRVLILDDDELFCHTLADHLRRKAESQFEVTAITTVEDARWAVTNAAQPFDVFLIDQRLGPGPDGIEVMQELRHLSPDTEAIIFTGMDDPEDGLRAYQAGAYRYLSKPFDTRELIWIVRSLFEWRGTRHERDWLKIPTEVMEEAQRALSFQVVADIIVKGSLRLGFERARLWLLTDDSQILVGINQVGNKGLNGFLNFRMPIAESPYSQLVLAEREPIFFQGRELGPGYLDKYFAGRGFQPPVSEWVDIPLWAGKWCLGKLTLDNAVQTIRLRSDQHLLLQLFGRQAAAALERAQLYEREMRKSQELEVLNQIGQGITTHAAVGNLDTLLWEVRAQVGKLMDVGNFVVALLDKETGQLDFRLYIENNKLRKRGGRLQLVGPLGQVISENKPLFLPQGDRAYRKARGIPLFGRQSQCWLGVPLRVGDHAVGAIAVQSYERQNAYSDEDSYLLGAVADQIAGAIQITHLKEQEAKSSRRLSVLHRASEEIMKLAEENEDWLWHATLTVATAEYALSLNRATLFLTQESDVRLRGRMGIGHFETGKAHRDWHKDRRARLDFDSYLQRLRAGSLKPTPVEIGIRGWMLDLNQDVGAFRQVLREGQRMIIPAAEIPQQLPPAFVERFGITDYAVVPLRAGSKVIGLVVVDNIHNREPLRAKALDHLEPLLAHTALTWENLRQRRARDALIDLNYTIMAEVSNQPLRETLTHVCRAARIVTGADSVAVYPLRPDAEPYQYDTYNVGYVGNENHLHLKSKPRQKGITAHILRSGKLVVPDVTQHQDRYDGQKLAEHPFLQRERIQSFIGTPVRDVTTGKLYGILYLNHRTPRVFTAQDVRQAESFASLAAVAISNARVTEGVREGLVAAKAQSQAQEKELTILHRVLEEALVADTAEERVVRALLNAARELLSQPEIRVGLLLRKWAKLERLGQELCELRRQFFLNPDGRLSISTEPDIYLGLSGLALQTGESQLVNDVYQGERAKYFHDDGVGTISELDVPIKLGMQVIGVFNTESPTSGAFTAVDKATLERLAAAAALALDNVRRQEHLYNLLSAASAVTAPTGLEETLKAIVSTVQKAAPGLSVLTIWYREPEKGRIVLGPHFGVRYVTKME